MSLGVVLLLSREQQGLSSWSGKQGWKVESASLPFVR